MKAGMVSLLFCLVVSAMSGQSDLYSALGKGDVAGISKYFDKEVELSILDREGLLNKEGAEARLREFFTSYPAKGYKPMHSGSSKTQESTYSIGELTTEKGVFRVYVYFTRDAERRTVAELRFEK
jgi:hypothetical protein